ncbi:PRTRC system protein A (plasmid) [Cupriavidus sp. KK10]|jgi:PRTRC genetic system protein A|uniref:PRTRC system protein A n=1 Tax=Cupriavidus sp. KK10 TaxID=1478019 RepID=UPI001BAAC332|nr:PRTRC system protein A [Cupriavidus sp. KK10]QUN31833.1 PRTRC system protein A [Cupriavidus sp. KK10]
MHPMDITLQQSFPTVMVPRFGDLAPLETTGERLLIAANGVFLEVSRPWLRLVRRVAQFDVKTAVPYGVAAETTDLRCGKLPAQLIGQFAEMARAAMPNETGGWIVWNLPTGAFRLAPVTILSHGRGHLQYERPALVDGEVVVVDCHSHGNFPAYFSSTDNEDDQHDVKFAFVMGNCLAATPSLCLRLCAKGIFEPVDRVPGDWYMAARAQEVV